MVICTGGDFNDFLSQLGNCIYVSDNILFFQSRNPGIGEAQSRNFGIENATEI